MKRRMFLGKIHRARVTDANLDYEGSVTVDRDLLDAAGMLEHEEVHVWNVTRGTRLVTYTLAGERGSGVVCLNGAAAHLNRPGDLVILATFGDLDEEEAHAWQPRVVFVDEDNRIRELDRERPGPAIGRHVAPS
ncbi:MAG: aspartate 1-decarboxylase [Sandaracinaceae bacterium]|nr:aspartate 1-decarboxylase [Sandaracinaceae bacterium]